MSYASSVITSVFLSPCPHRPGRACPLPTPRMRTSPCILDNPSETGWKDFPFMPSGCTVHLDESHSVISSVSYLLSVAPYRRHPQAQRQVCVSSVSSLQSIWESQDGQRWSRCIVTRGWGRVSTAVISEEGTVWTVYRGGVIVRSCMGDSEFNPGDGKESILRKR